MGHALGSIHLWRSMLHSVCSLVAIRYFSSPSPETCGEHARPDEHAQTAANRAHASYFVQLLVKVLQLRALTHALLRALLSCAAHTQLLAHREPRTLRIKNGVWTGVKPRRTRKASA